MDHACILSQGADAIRTQYLHRARKKKNGRPLSRGVRYVYNNQYPIEWNIHLLNCDCDRFFVLNGGTFIFHQSPSACVCNFLPHAMQIVPTHLYVLRTSVSHTTSDCSNGRKLPRKFRCGDRIGASSSMTKRQSQCARTAHRRRERHGWMGCSVISSELPRNRARLVAEIFVKIIIVSLQFIFNVYCLIIN